MVQYICIRFACRLPISKFSAVAQQVAEAPALLADLLLLGQGPIRTTPSTFAQPAHQCFFPSDASP